MIKRRKTRVVRIGDKKIGGNNPILVQSMTNTPTWDVEATVKQIKELEEAGCEIIRVSVPDFRSAKAIPKIKKEINIPLVADIHFSPKLAIESIKGGVDKIRINPGNFPKAGLKKVVDLCKEKGIPIRIGINSGSLEKDLVIGYGKVTAEMMVESALRSIRLIERFGFYDLVISLKAPDVSRTIRAYELLAEKTDYPFHLGITEAGTEFSGSIRSSIGIGYLLLKGIGDTIRVSLSADPIQEVKVGWEILKSLGLRERGVKIISCPTCARSSIDVIGLTKEIEKLTYQIKEPLRIAVMGCVVNGLGEGKESNLAIVGAGKVALIMRDGEIVQRTRKEEILKTFQEELKNYSTRIELKRNAIGL